MDLDEINELANQKENEWKEAKSMQIQSLQQNLKEKEEELTELNKKFLKLKDDFKYNLRLLVDRDKELKQYDEAFSQNKLLQSEHVNLISDLRIKIASQHDKLEEAAQLKNVMECSFRQQILDLQIEFDACKRSKNEEIQNVLKENSDMKITFEKKISFLESELQCQKMELQTEFEDFARRKENEDRQKWEEKNAEVFSHDLKAKLFSKEIELLKSECLKKSKQLKQMESEQLSLKNKLQKAEWDIKDISSVKNARIMELELEVKSFKDKLKNTENEFLKKHSELDKDIRLKQLSLNEARKAFLGRENELKEMINALKRKVEACEQETKRALWDKSNEAENHRENLKIILNDKENLQNEIKEMQEKLSQSTVAKDVEVETLKKQQVLSRKEIKKLQGDLENYKKQLSNANKIVDEAKKAKQQAELDMECKFENRQFKSYQQNETVISDLMKSKDEAIAENSILRAQISDLKNNIEQDKADIIEQNNQLRMVIQQMSKEMQELSAFPGQDRTTDNRPIPPNSEYVEALEKEVIELRKLKQLNNHDTDHFQSRYDSNLHSNRNIDKNKESSANTNVASNLDVDNHIKSLNNLVSDLQGEKMQLNAQIRKLEVRIKHYDENIITNDTILKRLRSQVQELEYENSTKQRRFDQENMDLKKRIADLELQLAETRKEADEYYKGGLKNNLIASELGNEISRMKVDFASSSKWVSQDSHKLLVGQLQKDVSSLRAELVQAKQLLILGDSKEMSGKLSTKLYAKLKEAASEIAKLLQEKSALERENKSLKNEMKENISLKPKLQKLQPEAGDFSNSEKSPSKLEQLEDLQYELTKQELKYAQRDLIPHKLDNFELPERLNQLNNMATESNNKEIEDDNKHSTHTQIQSTESPFQISLSSVGDSDMNEVWKLLDRNTLSAASTPRQTVSQAPSKPTKKLQVKKPPVRKIIKQKPKVRNYNIKDD